jgi:hypothetical protein
MKMKRWKRRKRTRDKMIKETVLRKDSKRSQNCDHSL